MTYGRDVSVKKSPEVCILQGPDFQEMVARLDRVADGKAQLSDWVKIEDHVEECVFCRKKLRQRLRQAKK